MAKITQDHFINHIYADLSVSKDAKILIAVSGGVDSMVLLRLLQQTSLTIGVAHIDHNTRSGASSEDAAFVSDYCARHNIPYFQAKYVHTKGNFHKEARKYRYQFFTKIANENNFDYVATAHHQEDQLESLLINIQRSAGLRGLQGITQKDKHLLRPLLIYTKGEIEAYAATEEITYVHDVSNDSDHYLRNKIRHHIAPAMKEHLPQILEGISRTTTLMQDYTALMTYFGRLVSIDRGKYQAISIDKILDSPAPSTFLYECIRDFGFTPSDAIDMLTANVGALFPTNSHQALRDRSHILIREKPTQKERPTPISISNVGSYNFGSTNVSVQSCEKNHYHALPYALLKQGITIRHWQAGDLFMPKGMKGKTQTVKKYLSNAKLNRFDKEDVLVALCDENIVAIVDHRTSEYPDHDTKYFRLSTEHID